MRNLKKRVTTLLLAGVMMAASFVPVSALENEKEIVVNGINITCYANCTSVSASAETSISLIQDNSYSSSSVYVGLTLYTLDLTDGSIDEYLSDTWEGSDWAEAYVSVSMNDRPTTKGYYVSSVHNARIDNVSGNTKHLITYNE